MNNYKFYHYILILYSLRINMKILYIFTFDYSLKTWKNSGILDRELEYFNELKNNIDITLITYGDASDEKFAENYGLNIYPLYKKNISKDQI